MGETLLCVHVFSFGGGVLPGAPVVAVPVRGVGGGDGRPVEVTAVNAGLPAMLVEREQQGVCVPYIKRFLFQRAQFFFLNAFFSHTAQNAVL